MSYRAACLLALAGLAALAGCVQETTPGGNAPANAPSAATKGPNDRLRVAVIPKGMTHQFWQTVKAGAEAAGKDLNAEILWQGPEDETNVRAQQDIVNRFATEGVDGIALAATDKAALSKTVDEVQAKGVPVVMIDSGIEPDNSKCFVATDNVAAARQAAEEMNRLVKGQGKVAVLSFKKGSGTSDEREQGFLEGIRQFSGITLVEPIQYTDSNAGRAQDRMETILSANADLAGVFASNEPNVLGAARVLKTRGLAGKVMLVGFDAAAGEIDYLKEGVVQALVVQDPFKMGYDGVRVLATLLRGQGQVPKRIDTGARIVTRENMTEPEIHKLLHPLEKP
jgi:ribose transport system substrate-binding protein